MFILEINKIFSFQLGENSAKYKVLTSPTTGLKVARTDLQLLLEPNHFRDGLFIAKCIASMFIHEINKLFSFQVGENSAKYKVLTSPTTGLKVACTDLRLLLEPYHFRDGLLIAKCIASMFTMHWQSTDISIKEESPTLASVVDHSNGAKNETEMGASTKNKVGTGFKDEDLTKLTELMKVMLARQVD